MPESKAHHIQSVLSAPPCLVGASSCPAWCRTSRQTCVCRALTAFSRVVLTGYGACAVGSGTGAVTEKLPDSHLSAGCLRRPIAEARQATDSLEPAVRELLSTRARGELLEAGAQRACSGISLHRLHCKAVTQARTPSPKRSSPGKAALVTDNTALDGSASCSTVPEGHR